MAVKIKLKRLGKVREPFYRIIVIDAHAKRDGRAIEEIGKYGPKEQPSLIEVNSDRVQHWLSIGAQPTEPVRAILRKTGDWQLFHDQPQPRPLDAADAKPDKKAVFEAAAQEAQAEREAEQPRAGQPAGEQATSGEHRAGENVAEATDTAAVSVGTPESASDPKTEAEESLEPAESAGTTEPPQATQDEEPDQVEGPASAEAGAHANPPRSEG